MIIHMKAIKQYFPVVIFIMLNKVGLHVWIKPYSATFQTKAIEQYFPVVLFVMLKKFVILTFESVIKILK